MANARASPVADSRIKKNTASAGSTGRDKNTTGREGAGTGGRGRRRGHTNGRGIDERLNKRYWTSLQCASVSYRSTLQCRRRFIYFIRDDPDKISEAAPFRCAALLLLIMLRMLLMLLELLLIQLLLWLIAPAAAAPTTPGPAALVCLL